jgi:hypothetical protein
MSNWKHEQGYEEPRECAYCEYCEQNGFPGFIELDPLMLACTRNEDLGTHGQFYAREVSARGTCRYFQRRKDAESREE